MKSSEKTAPSRQHGLRKPRINLSSQSRSNRIQCHTTTQISLAITWQINKSLLTGDEWVIKFNGLFGDRRHRGTYSPFKPCNHSLYIGIIIFPYIYNAQYICMPQLTLRKKMLKRNTKKWGHLFSEGYKPRNVWWTHDPRAGPDGRNSHGKPHTTACKLKRKKSYQIAPYKSCWRKPHLMGLWLLMLLITHKMVPPEGIQFVRKVPPTVGTQFVIAHRVVPPAVGTQFVITHRVVPPAVGTQFVIAHRVVPPAVGTQFVITHRVVPPAVGTQFVIAHRVVPPAVGTQFVIAHRVVPTAVGTQFVIAHRMVPPAVGTKFVIVHRVVPPAVGMQFVVAHRVVPTAVGTQFFYCTQSGTTSSRHQVCHCTQELYWQQ